MSTLTGGQGNIITNGLILRLDAANPRSYQSGSLIWNDLSGFGNSGSLVNGPAFNTSASGVIRFDGVDDYVSDSSIVLNSYTNFTVNIWVKFDVASRYEVIWSAYNGYFSVIKFPNTIYFVVSGTTGAAASTTTTILNNVWYNIVAVRSNGVSYLYLNGILEGTFTGTVNTGGATSEYRLGNYATSYYLSGNIASNIIYNRSLTQSEVQQNYNATRARFGV
jgi:hypothetical protein